MGSLSNWHWLILIIYLFVFLFPVAKIVMKAGYSGWWCLLAAIPLVNLVMLWIFAFASWPTLRDRQS